MKITKLLLLFIVSFVLISCEDPTSANYPDAPYALDASYVTENSFVANWEPVDDADSYRLDVATDVNFNNYLPDYRSRVVEDTYCNVNGLSDDTHYYYRVRAHNGDGNSSYSDVISVMTLDSGYFDLSFYNTTFTDIDISVNRYGTKIINPDETVTFRVLKTDNSYSYYASTSGQTTQGSQVGLKLEWSSTETISGSEYTWNLVVSEDYFYLKMRNNGSHNLSPLYVNYELAHETVDQIVIPVDDALYNIGYYRAYSNTVVAAFWQNENTYSYWRQGQQFNLPWTMNQEITLTNTSKNICDSQVVSKLPEITDNAKCGISIGKEKVK